MTAADHDKGAPARPETSLIATQAPGLLAATPTSPRAALPAAIRRALDATPQSGRMGLPPASADNAPPKPQKAAKSGAPFAATPRNATIGPRSGHK